MGQSKRKITEGKRYRVDPATCEKNYSTEDLAFLVAMERYKRCNKRPFPTWTEVLEVVRSLGYRLVAEPTSLPGTRPPLRLLNLEPVAPEGCKNHD